jgi:hypothetical protein
MSRKVATSVVACVLVASCASEPRKPFLQQSQDPSRFAYSRLYCTPDHESHFETAIIELGRVDATPPALPSFAKGNSAARLVFAGFDARWGSQDLEQRKFHPAPAAQFVIYLQGAMSITVTDGETRHFGPGDVLRVEDTTPCKGHISVIGSESAFTAISR